MRENSNTQSWLLAPDGTARGYIESQALTELWFHTGTNCNLSCPFCLEGSKPGDNRIQFIALNDVKPFVDEALDRNYTPLLQEAGLPVDLPIVKFPDFLRPGAIAN